MIKFILVLLLFVPVLYGETSESIADTSFYERSENWTGVEYKGHYYGAVHVRSYIVIVELLYLWEQYEKECYKDSFAVTFDEYLESQNIEESDLSFDDKVKLKIIKSINDSDRMMHERKEPDLPGFIEFLRTRIKEKK